MRLIGALAASVMILVVGARLGSTDWPAVVRAAVIVLPAMLWAATIAVAAEGILLRNARLGPAWLGLIGSMALSVALALAVGGAWRAR